MAGGLARAAGGSDGVCALRLGSIHRLRRLHRQAKKRSRAQLSAKDANYDSLGQRPRFRRQINVLQRLRRGMKTPSWTDGQASAFGSPQKHHGRNRGRLCGQDVRGPHAGMRALRHGSGCSGSGIMFHRFHKGALILREASGLFVVFRRRETFRIFLHLATVSFIRLKIGKTE